MTHDAASQRDDFVLCSVPAFLLIAKLHPAALVALHDFCDVVDRLMLAFARKIVEVHLMARTDFLFS